MCRNGSKEIKNGANRMKNKYENDFFNVKSEKIIASKHPYIIRLQNIEYGSNKAWDNFTHAVWSMDKLTGKTISFR